MNLTAITLKSKSQNPYIYDSHEDTASFWSKGIK